MAVVTPPNHFGTLTFHCCRCGAAPEVLSQFVTVPWTRAGEYQSSTKLLIVGWTSMLKMSWESNVPIAREFGWLASWVAGPSPPLCRTFLQPLWQPHPPFLVQELQNVGGGADVCITPLRPCPAKLAWQFLFSGLVSHKEDVGHVMCVLFLCGVLGLHACLSGHVFVSDIRTTCTAYLNFATDSMRMLGALTSKFWDHVLPLKDYTHSVRHRCVSSGPLRGMWPPYK